jgi:hypothetical protein
MSQKMSASERALANSKKIPRRSSRLAEEYAEKVRMEPPKPTRQETETLDTSIYSGIPGQRLEDRSVAFMAKKAPEAGKPKKAA